jgi:hypothetical protein
MLGPLSLVKTTEELLERKVAAPVYKTEINDRGNTSRRPRDTLYPQKLALTSSTSGGRSRTKATEFSFNFSSSLIYKNRWQISASPASYLHYPLFWVISPIMESKERIYCWVFIFSLLFNDAISIKTI